MKKSEGMARSRVSNIVRNVRLKVPKYLGCSQKMYRPKVARRIPEKRNKDAGLDNSSPTWSRGTARHSVGTTKDHPQTHTVEKHTTILEVYLAGVGWFGWSWEKLFEQIRRTCWFPVIADSTLTMARSGTGKFCLARGSAIGQ